MNSTIPPQQCLLPKEPANECGCEARKQFLKLARQIIGEAELDYETLYKRFAENDWASVLLNRAVATLALNQGHTVKRTEMILLQSPYIQHHFHQNQVPLLPLSVYVRSLVRELAMHKRLKQHGLEV
jgi:hypothetical protein